MIKYYFCSFYQVIYMPLMLSFYYILCGFNHFTFGGQLMYYRLISATARCWKHFPLFEDIMVKLMSEISAALPRSCQNELICTSYGLITLTYTACGFVREYESKEE